VCIALPPLRAPTKNSTIFASSRAGQYRTVTATSRRLSSARFNGDIGYVVTDVYLLRRCVATRGRGCRPQRVDFGRKQSTQAVTSCRLDSLPQRTNPHPAHVRPYNTTWPTSHASALLWGGVMPTNKRGYYNFYYFFIYYFLFYANPLLFHPLVLSTSTSGRLMILLLTTKRLC
jgi:hypothetical protein